MNKYVGFYKNKRFETEAKTSYEAQKKMAAEHKVKKAYQISVILAEKDGKQVTHDPSIL